MKFVSKVPEANRCRFSYCRGNYLFFRCEITAKNDFVYTKMLIHHANLLRLLGHPRKKVHKAFAIFNGLKHLKNIQIEFVFARVYMMDHVLADSWLPVQLVQTFRTFETACAFSWSEELLGLEL